ncbi:DNA/RNA polymerases superfamily protein [Tanacetum coccineum]
MADHYQKWHNETSTRCKNSDTSDGLAAIQAQLINLGGEIKKKKGRHLKKHTTLNLVYHSPKEEDIEQLLQDYTKEIMEILCIKSEGKQWKNHYASLWLNQGSGSLPGSTETNPRDHVKSISTTVKAETPSIHHIRTTRYVVLSPHNSVQLFNPNQSIIHFPSRLIDNSYKEKEVLEELMKLQIDSKKSATNLKRLFKERSRIDDEIKASMNVHSSAILEYALPPKEKVPRSFTIPYSINNICFEKALADLGASVNVMPYSTFTNLNLGELAPTKLIIELDDRTVKCPKGLAENVLVGIGKFVFPVNFIVLDMPEDIKIPLILERPFLSTAHAKIYVFKSKIALKARNDKIVFKSDNPTSNIIKKVYVLGLRERMELDLEARLMGKALILDRS